MGTLQRILVKRARRGPMDDVAQATLRAGRGLVGNADQGGTRQVTIVSADRWAELMAELASDLDPRTRRANLVVAGLDLEGCRGRTLHVGACRILVRGETRPCEQMEAALPGLRAAMRHRWGGGAYAEVVEGGEIAVGDRVQWEESSPGSVEPG